MTETPLRTFCAATGSAAKSPEVAAELLQRWSDSCRGYHDVLHLREVLDRLTELGHEDPICILAAWFHDAVYTGTNGDDEAASAELARVELTTLGVAGQLVEQVVTVVQMTASHQPDDDPHQLAFADADLAILAAPAARYDAYVRMVRRDFSQFDDATFAVGRRAFVEGMLGRDRIFCTPLGLSQWEARARRNLARELEAVVVHSR